MIISTRVELASDYIQIILICLAKIPSRNRNRFMPHCLRWLVLDIKVQSSGIPKSQTECYVEKKDEYEREYSEKLKEIEAVLNDLSFREKRFFKDHLIHGIKIRQFEKIFRCGPDMVEHIKKSSIIKFALALDLVVYK